MKVIVWSVIDFHVVDILPKGSKFNTCHYISAILQSFADWNIGEIGTIDWKLIVHIDNAQPHTSKVSLAFIEQNWMKRASYPPYLRDLTHSDFFFGYSKDILSNRSFQSVDYLLFANQIMLTFIDKVVWLDVSLSRYEVWSNLAMLIRTTSNDLNNHIFDYIDLKSEANLIKWILIRKSPE
jgi:hypothetical protein